MTLEQIGFLGPIVVHAAAFARSAVPLLAPFSFAVAALALAGFFSSGATTRPALSVAASVGAVYHLAAPRSALAHIAYQLKMRDSAKCAQLLLLVGLALLPSSIEGGVARSVVEGVASALALVPYIGAPCAGGLRYAAAFALSTAATVRSWSRCVPRPACAPPCTVLAAVGRMVVLTTSPPACSLRRPSSCRLAQRHLQRLRRRRHHKRRVLTRCALDHVRLSENILRTFFDARSVALARRACAARWTLPPRRCSDTPARLCSARARWATS